ncbi:MAG: MerC domain-containing protein [Pseudomonadota bacterium]
MRDAIVETSTTKWDSAAIGLSAACLVHCLALPILASVLPLAGLLAEAEWIHWVFVALAFPASVLAFRARPLNLWETGLRGLAAIGLSALVLAALGWPDHEFETPLTVFGGLVLAAAHGLHFFGQHRRLSNPPR